MLEIVTSYYPIRRLAPVAAGLLLLALLTSGCNQSQANASGPTTSAPPQVGVLTVHPQATMQDLVAKLPHGITSEWTGLSYEEEKAGAQTGPLYAISLMLILLCLAALYESWPIPVAVLLVVPLGVIGAIAGTLLRGLDNGVYFQVGLLTTVGLAVKNAILIVEFAKAFYDAGLPLAQAAIKAAGERLRPILMASRPALWA